jgi:integrase/recombinase XerC
MSAIVPNLSHQTAPALTLGHELSGIASVAQDLDDVWAEFLKLHISPNTQRTYATAINDFFLRLTGSGANPYQIRDFLNLPQHQAIGVVLKYKALLVELGLAPATVNTRLAAIKSLVDHARKQQQCRFSLEDVPHLKVTKYRDTTGVGAMTYRGILKQIDQSSLVGKRDYALLRLLWDNALRRGEIVATNLEHFRDGKLWIIGKGKLELEAIELVEPTRLAVAEWIEARSHIDPQRLKLSQGAIFVALDSRSIGQRLSGRSVARVVERLANAAEIGKQLSPHRVRHSSITAFLDASGGDVRTAQKLSRHSRLETLSIYDDNRKGLQGKASSILANLI